MQDITIDDITSGSIDGDGIYDKLMQVNKLHLQEEYKAQRITGDMYAQAYIAMMQAAMATSTGFAIQAFTANNQRELTEEEKKRILAQTAQIEAETLNVPKQGVILDKQANQIDAQTSLVGAQEAQVVQETANLVKQATVITNQGLQIAAETLNIPKQGIILDKQADNLTKEGLQIVAQTSLVGKQEAQVTAETLNVPKQGMLIDAQKDVAVSQKSLITNQAATELKQALNVDADTKVKTAQNLLIGKQEDMVDAQILTEKANTTNPTGGIKKAEYDNLLKQGLNIESNTDLVTQKKKTEEAQIKDRVTGESTDVAGVVGSQKKVHTAQAKAFKDESFIKAAKQHADAFAVILSNDDAATIPSAFNEASINAAVAGMITQIKA